MTLQMSSTIGELAAALCKAQSTMKGAIKDSANPFFKAKYADLASVWDAARDALSANGLSVAQPPTSSAGGKVVTVTTILMHTSGEYLMGDFSVEAKDAGPQALGSAITYARRYGLAAMVGVSPEDDDGEQAENRGARLPPNRREKQLALPGPIGDVAAGISGMAQRMEILSLIDSLEPAPKSEALAILERAGNDSTRLAKLEVWLRTGRHEVLK